MARLCLRSRGRRFVNRAVGIPPAIEDEGHVCSAPRLAVGPAGPAERRQVHHERFVFRTAAFPGDPDARGLPHPVGDPLPGALPRALDNGARRKGDDILEEAPRRLPPAGGAKVMEAVARGPRQPPSPFGAWRHGQPASLDEMFVGVATAEEPVVVTGMGAGEALRDREPVAGGASPEIPERPLRLGTRLPRRSMIGDQRQGIEIDAEIGRRHKLRHPARLRERQPLPPRRLPLGDGVGTGKVAEGKEIPGVGEEDVRVARLDAAAANRREGVARHRVDQLAAAGRQPAATGARHEPAIVLEAQKREQLPGKLAGVGVGHLGVSEPPAEVPLLRPRGRHLHRAGQLQARLDRCWIPAAPGGFEGVAEEAADADGSVAAGDHFSLDIKALEGIESRLTDRGRRLAANPDVAEAGRAAVVLEGEKAGEGLGADLGDILLVNILNRAAIHDDADPRSHEAHLEIVPFPGRADGVFQRGDVAVEGAGGMGRRRAPGIVEKLELVAADARPRRP